MANRPPRYQENMIPYEYVEYATQGRDRVIVERVITDWSQEKRQRRGLKVRLVMLAQVDRDQAVGSLIFKTEAEGIYYAKITPSDADARALVRMREVEEDDSRRLKIRFEELAKE